MKNKTRAGFLLITIAAGLTGCDGASPTAPAPALPQVDIDADTSAANTQFLWL